MMMRIKYTYVIIANLSEKINKINRPGRKGAEAKQLTWLQATTLSK